MSDTTTTAPTTDATTDPAAPKPRKFYSVVKSDGVRTTAEGTELLINTMGFCIVWDGPNIVNAFWQPRQVRLTKIVQPAA